MKHALVALVLALVMTAPAFAQTAYPLPAPPLATMTLAGDGLVERAPDMARLAVSIVTNDDNATLSSSKNNDIYNALRAGAARLGLTNDALRTTSYNVVFVPHPPRGLPPEQQLPRYGYVTTRTMTVTVTPIENVGKVIDAATAAGVTNVGAVTFDLKDRKAAYNAALAAAMSDVKTTAQLLSSAGGFSIVRIQTVNVNSNVPLMMFGRVQAAAAPGAFSGTPTDIQPNGPISISAHISVTYVIR